MKTWYVDKRVNVNGNGSALAPFKAINAVCSTSVGADAVIEIVKDSGPYIYGTDFGYLAQPNIYFTHSNLNTVTWNFNGNTLTSEIELIGNESLKWNKSATGTDIYFCTLLNDANPNIPIIRSAVIDGDWNAESTSLFGDNPTNGTTRFTKVWGYGDIDSLGFNTIYIYIKGANPIDIKSILLSRADSCLFLGDPVTNPAHEFFNDAVFRGGGDYTGRMGMPFDFNKCTFENTNYYPIRNTTSSTKFYFCRFINTGHEAVHPNTVADLTISHCHIENSHTVAKISGTTSTANVSITNCTTKNLLAGGLQVNLLTTAELTENNNQWHIDPDSEHGGEAIAFESPGFGKKWTITSATDLPASTSTDVSVGVDPQVTSSGKLLPTSPCIDKGTYIQGVNMEGQLDPWGKKVHSIPNIGVDQGAGAPKSGSRQTLQLGSNRGFFS